MGRWAVEQGRRMLYLRVVGMLLGGHRRLGSSHTVASKWRRPYHARAWSERTAGTADRDVLPQRRRTEKRCTSSLSAGVRGCGRIRPMVRERERPLPPCLRYHQHIASVSHKPSVSHPPTYVPAPKEEVHAGRTYSRLVPGHTHAGTRWSSFLYEKAAHMII